MDYALSKGETTADGIVVSGAGGVASIDIITDGTNNATVILYDNTAASGTKIFEGGCVGANLSKTINFDRPIKYKTGVYADLTGTGASIIVRVT